MFRSIILILLLLPLSLFAQLDSTLNTDSLLRDSAVEEDLTDGFMELPVMPEFPGGDIAMLEFIKNNLVYPPYALENNIQGKTVIEFLIDAAGRVTDIQVISKLGYGCDEAAIDVLKLMPAWKPGSYKGKNISVKYRIPVVFQLKGKNWKKKKKTLEK